MKTSPAGRALIEACEGLRLKAYPDSVGVLTIGVGHTTAAGPPVVKSGMVLEDRAEADAILARDLEAVERDVESRVKVALTQGQFDALVSFTFNLGAGNLGKSTLLKKLNTGDYAGAAGQFGRWNKAGGRVLDGLTTRRKAERLLFEGDTEAALRMVGATLPNPDKDYWEAQHNKPAPEPPPPDPDKPAGFVAITLAIIKAIFGKGA